MAWGKGRAQREQTLNKFELLFGWTLPDALPQTWLVTQLMGQLQPCRTWELWSICLSFP